MFGDKNTQHIGEAGHRINCSKEGSEKTLIVGLVRIVPVNAVLDGRQRLRGSLRR